ncbi:MAG: acyl-CoA dehydrogenase family protein [Acidimicrobiia bacterium]|nr:acyl-CoA dehydrogenase family protein [Acidimicrobiia bacterium]
MRIALTPEQEALRDKLRNYFDDICTPEFRAEQMAGHMEGGGPLYWKALRKMAADGWLGIGWPTEYGGGGATPIEQMIFADEAHKANFPFPFLSIGTVGPTIMRYGTDEQKQDYLPRILAGEINFCIGYTEPSAGTDLASLTTRAVRDGDDWIINGQKIFTSLAEFAQYVWLAARTDPDAPKHAGLSIFVVPMDAEGVSLTPIETVGGVRTNSTYYENVRVPAEALVGGENNGWAMIVSQLNHERVSLTPTGPPLRLVEQLCEWARETETPDGRRVADLAWVQNNLARARSGVEILKLMNWKQAWEMTHGHLNPAEASAVKVFASEFTIRCYELLMEVMGQAAVVKEGSPGAVLRGEIELRYRTSLILTFGGGTNEVQRDITAMAGLGLPHYKG